MARFLILISFLVLTGCESKTQHQTSSKSGTWICNVAETNRISSNHYSDFVIDSTEFRTTSSWDQDGLLLKINSEGDLLWHKQIGNSGTTTYGYRTIEGVWDLCTSEKGVVIAATLEYKIDQNNSKKEVKLIEFDRDGNELRNSALIDSKTGCGAQAVVRIDADEWHVAGMHEGKMFIAKLNKDWERQELHNGGDESAGMIRVGNYFGDAVFFTGHYRNALNIGTLQKYGAQGHNLFLMKWN